MKLQGIKKICKKCKAKCCKLGGPDFTKKEMLRIVKLKPKYKDLFDKVGRNHYELKVKKGMCSFLSKDYSCSIHKMRPLVCRCWPVYAEGKDGKKKYFLIQCPLAKHLSKNQIQTMKKQASKVPKDVMEGIKTNLPKEEYNLCMKRFKKLKKKTLK